MVCTRMFGPHRVGGIPEVCFMHIKRAECGETTWGLHFMQKQQCNEIRDSKGNSEVLAGVCWSKIQDPLGWVCDYK